MLAWTLALSLAAPAGATAAQNPPEADVATGVRQVQEGDFEAAVATLEAAIPRLRGDPQRVRLLVQADIQLGVAHVALDHTAEAVRAFAEALTLDPRLRLTAERFSPKVLRAFETARAQTQGARETGRGRSSRKRALIMGGAAAVVAAGAAVAATRGAATPTFASARFGTPVLVCPNGSENVALPFEILVEAANSAGDAVAIRSVTSTVRIVNGSVPSEFGFASTRPSTVLPSSIPAKQDVTLRVESTLLCGNGFGDPARFNEWSGRVTFETSAGVFMVDVVDRMIVNIP